MLLIILCSWKLWLLPLTLLTTCVVTTPVDTAKLFHVVQTLRSNRVIRRQADSTPFPIRGVDTVGVYPRLEVRQLEQNPDQWNLYMLGLTAMQSVNQTDELSWYQIAGQLNCFSGILNIVAFYVFVLYLTVRGHFNALIGPNTP